MKRERGFGTRAVHAGRRIDRETGAVTPPIHLSSTFARDEHGELLSEFLYGRYQNPNRRDLEACLVELEGARAGACFASGSAAATALLQTLSQGDRIILGDDLYFGIRKLFLELGPRTGVEIAIVDLSDLGALEAALAPGGVKIVFGETPSNPLLKIFDIRGAARLAHAKGAVLAVDNTWGTPVLSRPLEHDADFVLHATTKALAGHSDVVGGAILAADPEGPLWKRLVDLQRLAGAVPSPFDCWLTLRGIATLPLRVRAATDNAERIAGFLANHAAVEAVYYPGLSSHPAHALAARQMTRPGAMLSFLARGGEEAARSVIAKVRLWIRATSLGGVHSLIEHRAAVEGPSSLTPRNLIRLSAGIEDAEDLLDDLAAALSGDIR